MDARTSTLALVAGSASAPPLAAAWRPAKRIQPDPLFDALSSGQVTQMPQTCTVCRHVNLANIDSALLRRDSLRDVARQFGLSKDAVARHKADHLPKKLMKAQEAKEVLSADSLLSDVRNGEGRAERLYGAAEGILERALEAKDLKTALGAIRAAVDVMGEARQYLELRGELTGELSDRGQAPHAVQLMNILMLPVKQEVTHIVDAKPAGDLNG